MTVTDDDLGARLHAALQDISPLATDPVPPPRFAHDAADLPTAAPPTDTEPTATDVDLDVVELGPVRDARRSRRLVAAVSLLTAAAAAAVAVTLTTDLGRGDGPAPAGPAASVVPTPVETATVPDRHGAYLGITPDPVPYRCTAPAGTTIAATRDPDQYRPTVWTVAAGVTCAPYPADRGRFTFSDDGRSASFGTGEPDEVTGGGSGAYCLFVATQTSVRDASFVSRGDIDHLEFYGSGCRLVLPAR